MTPRRAWTELARAGLLTATVLVIGCGGAAGGDDDDAPGGGDPVDASPDASGGFRPEGVVTLVSGEDLPNGIVADPAAVYWVNVPFSGGVQGPSSIRRLDLQTRAVTTFVADAGGAFRVFADADELFFATSGDASRIEAVDKRTGDRRLVIDGLGQAVARLALDADRVYFAAYDPGGSRDVLVRSVKKDGTDPRELGRVPAAAPYDVVVDDTRVFVAGEVAVYAVPKAGGEATLIGDGLAGSEINLAADGDHVYVTNRRDRTVGRILKTGSSAPENFAQNQPVPGRLVVAGTTVYWTCRGGATGTGTVARWVIGGGAPQVIAGELRNAAEIAVLPEAIVWTNRGTLNASLRDGSIMAAPR